LGTSGTRIEASGTPIDHEEYYPFGDSSLRTFSKKRYRYVGKEKDGESGLYYYGARYYAAWAGRFVSVDPLADSYPYFSPYNYAGNKPINGIDVDGFQSSVDLPVGDGPTNGSGTDTPSFTADAKNIPEVFGDKPKSWFRRYVVDNIPVVGGIVNAVESFKHGDVLGGVLGVLEAVLDVVLFVTTGGIGNVIKAGIKAGAKAVARAVAKEFAENAAQAVAGDALEAAGIAPEAVQAVQVVLNPGKAGDKVDDTLGAAKKKGKRAPDCVKEAPSPAKRTSDPASTTESPSAEAPAGTKSVAGSKEQQALPSPKVLHRHHILPREFKKWFRQRGIKNIDDYTIEIAGDSHQKGVHGKGLGNLPGDWNPRWDAFIRKNPYAEPGEIMKHAEDLLSEFGLGHARYVRYRSKKN